MELKVELLLLRVEKTQLRNLGNLTEIPPGLLPEEVFQACPLGRRTHCRSRTRWRDYLFLTGECLGIPSKVPPRRRRQMYSHGFKQWLEKEIPPDLWNFLLKWNNRASGFAGASNGGCVQISCGHPNDWALSSEGNDLVLIGQCCSSQCPPYKRNQHSSFDPSRKFPWSKSSWTFGMEGKGTMSVAQFNSRLVFDYSSTRAKSFFNPEKRHISTNIVISLYLGSKCKGQRLFVTC